MAMVVQLKASKPTGPVRAVAIPVAVHYIRPHLLNTLRAGAR